MNVKSDGKSASDEREGAMAAAGFAIVLVLVGMPVWWYTTTVYRAYLPYSTIENLSHQLRYHTVAITVVTSNPPSITFTLQDKLKSMDGVKFMVSGRAVRREEKRMIDSSTSLNELDASLSQRIHVFSGNLAVVVLDEEQNDELLKNSSVVVGRHRTIFVKPSVDVSELAGVIQRMVMDPLANKRVHSHHNHKHKQEAMRQVPTEPGYDVTLTLMVPEPHSYKVHWDAKADVDEYLGALVSQVGGSSVVRVVSQVLYMTALKVAPKWSPQHQHHALPHHQLPLTINAIESKLGSFVNTRPSLHFVIYIPKEKQMPLIIHSPDGSPLPSNSFLVPRWGGVMIHNVPGDNTTTAAISDNSATTTTTTTTTLLRHITLDSHWVMTTIITQLHRLLPIPVLDADGEVEVLGPSTSYQLAEWQVDGLARARVSAYLANIRTTLQSLCELVGEISNMVISEEVGGWVWGAVEEWGECGRAAREGRLQEATQYCTRSFTQADAAFFHPSMLALLYFPDNQKYAIYVPLFLPVSIPVLLSLKMVFSLFRKTKSTKEKEE